MNQTVVNEAKFCECGCGKITGPKARFCAGHNTAHPIKPISSEDLGRLYGTLLGDTYIGYPHKGSHSPRFSMNHGKVASAYANHKAAKLSSFYTCVKDMKNGGFGDMNTRVTSQCHPVLVEVHATINPGINQKWLDSISDEGVAWWYMDDGSASFGRNDELIGVSFHTNAYNSGEHEILVRWLNSKGFDAKISISRKLDGRQFLYLRLNKDMAYNWVREFKKYVAPGMEYKFCEHR